MNPQKNWRSLDAASHCWVRESIQCRSASLLSTAFFPQGAVFTPKELCLTAQGCPLCGLPWEEWGMSSSTLKGLRHEVPHR